MTEHDPLPSADETLEARGATCATLTPLIRATLRELNSGAILQVRTDDPSAHEGIPAWSRLTGNELLAAIEESDQTNFYLRKK